MILYSRDYGLFYIPRSIQWIDNKGEGRGGVGYMVVLGFVMRLIIVRETIHVVL